MQSLLRIPEQNIGQSQNTKCHCMQLLLLHAIIVTLLVKAVCIIQLQRRPYINNPKFCGHLMQGSANIMIFFPQNDGNDSIDKHVTCHVVNQSSMCKFHVNISVQIFFFKEGQVNANLHTVPRFLATDLLIHMILSQDISHDATC